MARKDIREIFQRIGAETANEQDEQSAKYWLHYFQKKDVPVLSEEELNEESDAIYRRLMLQYDNKTIVKRIWPRAIAAAAAVAAVVFGIWFYTSDHTGADRNAEIAIKNDIRPGTNKATLTLADGKIIQLSAAKSGIVIGDDLKYDDNSIVSQSGNDGSLKTGDDKINLAEGEVQTLMASTPRGGTYAITLPDGTKAWLNAASKINFPSRFSGNTREVSLTGEAYFEVAKDKKHPFIVKTKGQEITVLGTHFNVNAYPEDGYTNTTLLEGLVHVVVGSGSSAREVVLKPGQRAASKGTDIRVDDVDADEAVAWKEGYFTFNRETLESVMSQIARWYDVEIIYQDERIKSIPFSGSITRFGNISEILRKVELTEEVRFKVEGRKIFINHH
ncbi:FecR family protein [Pedobacter frigoris]|uniref:FecR family protein n=1 Tax=Pedobacter frigoris TaxID=2571272 RepID=UPI00292F730D|nr:FecR domain-containing protein [Pedobacter frigoris]